MDYLTDQINKLKTPHFTIQVLDFDGNKTNYMTLTVEVVEQLKKLLERV